MATPECRRCRAQLMWKQPYKKGDLPVNPNGSIHTCRGSLFQNLEVWKRKWDEIWVYQVPIYCSMCLRSFKREFVCKHIRSDGFRESIDTVEFYSDKYTAVKRRAMLKAEKKRALEPKKPRAKRKTYK